MDRLRKWIDALAAAGCNPVKRGHYWHALCPAHDDREPSLSLLEGDDGKLTVTCFAGCDYRSIADAVRMGERVASDRPSEAYTRGEQQKSRPPDEPRPLPRNAKLWRYHADDGGLVAVVCRVDSATGGKKVWQMTPADPHDESKGFLPKGVRGRKMPLYGLADVRQADERAVIAVVEGEKCADACRQAWPQQVTVTWAGGTNAWQKTDWTPLTARTVHIVADGDDAGWVCANDLADRLASLGCEVQLTLPPKDGSDIADWLIRSKQHAGEVIAAHKRPYTASEASEVAKPPPGPVKPGDAESGGKAGDSGGPRHPLEQAADILEGAAAHELEANEHYRLLGLDGERIAVRTAAGQILKYTRLQMTQINALISLAPQTWWVLHADGPVLGGPQARNLGDNLIRLADMKGPVDLSSVTGRGAVKAPDGRVYYHLGDRLVNGTGDSLGLDVPGLICLAQPKVKLDPPAPQDVLVELASAVMEYRWLTADDGRRVLGWIAAALVGGALDWRPHLLMTAPAESGKTWLITNVIGKLLGPLKVLGADVSAAALARVTGQSSLPVIVDEAEADNTLMLAVIEQLRIASGGDAVRMRAEVAGEGVQVQAPRYCALLSGTTAPVLKRADASRLSRVRFGPGHSPAEFAEIGRRITAAMRHADAVRATIIGRAELIVAAAAELAEVLQSDGVESREALISAALTAGWAIWGVDAEVVSAGTGRAERTDAADALLDILALRVRIGGGIEESILGLVSSHQQQRPIADLYGIKREGDALLLLPDHPGLAKEMGRTRWGRVDLRPLLLQLPGAERTGQRYFGAIRRRAVKVPAETLTALGIAFREQPVRSDDGDPGPQEPPPPESMF